MAEEQNIFTQENGQRSYNIAKNNFYLIDQFFLGNHREDIPTINDIRDCFYRCLRELNTAFRCGIIENCNCLPKQEIDVLRYDYQQLAGLYYLLKEDFFPFDDCGDSEIERELKNIGQDKHHPIGIHSIDNHVFCTDIDWRTKTARTKPYNQKPRPFSLKRNYSEAA